MRCMWCSSLTRHSSAIDAGWRPHGFCSRIWGKLGVRRLLRFDVTPLRLPLPRSLSLSLFFCLNIHCRLVFSRRPLSTSWPCCKYSIIKQWWDGDQNAGKLVHDMDLQTWSAQVAPDKLSRQSRIAHRFWILPFATPPSIRALIYAEG